MVAPILISFYNRNEHFKKTVESLRRNRLSDETDLYVAIDYPNDSFARNAQNDVRAYLSSLSGFKNVFLIEREVNFGAYKNVVEALHCLFCEYECVVLTEDDNEFSPLFLEYMNSNIERYKNNDDVYSVCAYLEPCCEDSNDRQVKCFSRSGFTSYGFCLWRDKYYQYENSDIDIRDEKKSIANYLALLKGLHYHVLSGLIYSAENDAFFSDYDMIYYMYVTGKKCIFPSKTLVRNIGQDGSGINSSIDPELLKQKVFMTGEIDFDLDFEIDESMRNLLFLHHKRDFFRRVYYYFRFLLL